MKAHFQRVMLRLSRLNEYRPWFILAVALGFMIINMPGDGGGGGV